MYIYLFHRGPKLLASQGWGGSLLANSEGCQLSVSQRGRGLRLLSRQTTQKIWLPLNKPIPVFKLENRPFYFQHTKLVSTGGEPRRDLFLVRSNRYLIQVFGGGHPVLWQHLLWCTGAIAGEILNVYLPEATEYFLQPCVRPRLPLSYQFFVFFILSSCCFCRLLAPLICASYTQPSHFSLL